MPNQLRVLLVESDPAKSERIAKCLERGNYAVQPTGCLEEATEALDIQRFDAIMLPSTFVNDQLLNFRDSLNRFETREKAPVHIPVLCYASAAAEQPSPGELSRCRVDACLPENFDALSFSQVVSGLASGLTPSLSQQDTSRRRHELSRSLPIFEAGEFQEQVGFDRELIVELIDLFLTDSQTQLESMGTALQAGDLFTLSRVAHSLKGSLGSLYAKQSMASAQQLETVAKAGDRTSSVEALARLEAGLQDLRPELLQLRQAALSS